MKLVFVTNNRNKVREINALLGDKFKIYSLSDIDCNEEIPETSDTIEGNAIQKARYVANKYNVDCFADDTGLEVEALNGQPGVYTARYAGEQCNANDNMEKLLRELDGEHDRRARFKTVIALIRHGQTLTFEGIAEGSITTEMSGKEGFGYDPVFQPNGYEITFAEMEMDEKNKISHRGKAVRKLADHLLG